LTIVTEPTVVEVVYAYTVKAVPAEGKDSEATPLAVVTVAGVAVFSADTNLTVDEPVKTTDVPVAAVAAIATDVPAVIALAEGTDTVFGAADVVTFVTPSTVTTGADAFDDVAISIVPVRAAAMTKLIFLNEFIFLLV
jgi:hypothetical protein